MDLFLKQGVTEEVESAERDRVSAPGLKVQEMCEAEEQKLQEVTKAFERFREAQQKDDLSKKRETILQPFFMSTQVFEQLMSQFESCVEVRVLLCSPHPDPVL